MRPFLLKLVMPMLALSLQGQPGRTISIQGTVLNPSGKPVEGAVVTLTQKRWDYWSFARTRNVKSDDRGHFEFQQATSMPCTLYVHLDKDQETFVFSASANNPVREWSELISAKLIGPVTLLDGTRDFSMLDMTSPTQGQTFRMDETRAIPLR